MRQNKENEVPLPKQQKVNWGMLISHHPPVQYDRTFYIGRVRFCVRCSAMIVGGIASIIFLLFTHIQLGIITLSVIVFFCTLPGVLNFTLNELKRTKNNNYKRAASGFLLGLPLGYVLFEFFNNRFLFGLFILGWYIVLEIIVVLVLKKGNVIDDYIKQYEDGIY